jgi:hypothetical protein
VPVKPNPKDGMPGMRILVFGQNSTCDIRFGPGGNGHELRAGAGTPKVTFDISGLTPGTVYIQLVEGVVVSADGGVPNTGVPCVGIPAGEPVGPTYRFGQADVDHNAIDMTFDSYANFGDPSQLFVYGSDPTCTTLAGRGTKMEHETQYRSTVTVTAVGFVIGTNYIRIEPGLVTGSEGGRPNTASPCTPVRGFDEPKFVRTTIDLTRSTVSITYDRPVHLSSYVAVYTATDPSYQDWARTTRYVGMDGPSTIVLEAANLRPGTNYIKIWAGFVGSEEAGVLNETVEWFPVEA